MESTGYSFFLNKILNALENKEANKDCMKTEKMFLLIEIVLVAYFESMNPKNVGLVVGLTVIKSKRLIFYSLLQNQSVMTKLKKAADWKRQAASI